MAMIRRCAIALFSVLYVGRPDAAAAQARHVALTTTHGLRPHNVTAEVATFKEKRGVRVVVPPEIARRPEYLAGQLETYVQIEGLEFSSGVIEAEIAGSPADGAPPGARGFVGVAF